MPPTIPKFAGAIAGRHLGRLRTPESRRAAILPLAPFLKRYGAKPPPDSVAYTDQAKKSLAAMLANNQWGDCTIAATLHGLTVARAVVPGGVDAPANDGEAVTQYHAICGSGDPGCYIPDVLDHLRDKGMTAAGRTTKSEGYASLKLGDQLLAKLATYLFGGAHLGINLPREWYENAGPGAKWDVTDTDIVGGHSIQVVGYGPDGLLVSTWGQVVTLTWAAYSDRRWVEEAYAILHQDWFTSAGLDAHGVQVQALRDALAAIAAGGVPVIPDPTPPPPVPPGPGGGGTIALDGAMSVLGAHLPIHLEGKLSAAAMGLEGAGVSISWLTVMLDVTRIINAAAEKDWVGVVNGVEQLLTDLGISFTPQERRALYSAIQTRAELLPLDDSAPPDSPPPARKR